MKRRNSATSPVADDRFNMDVPAELAERITELLLEIEHLAQTRPMAVVRIAIKMQANLRTIERNAALFGNHHYRISWEKIGELFNKSAQWAYQRYVELPRKAALSGAIRIAELSKSEVEKQPEN